MKRSDWKMRGTLVVVLGFAGIANAAQPQPPQPPAKTTGAQTYGYWVGDTSGSKGSYLGVDVADISKDRVSSLKLKDEHGVEITMVDQDAPAGKAGLKEHDVILEYNGARVEGEEQLRRMIRETPPGRKVTLGISRDGQQMQVPVTLAEHSKATAWSGSPMMTPMPPMPPMPAMPNIPAMPAMDFEMPDINIRSYSQTAGMMVDNLTPQLGEFFGVKSGQGVLVRSVEKGSAAESAGLKAGDVIVKIGDEHISDRSDFRRAIRDRKSAKVPLGIIREKKEQTLTITLSAPRARDSSRLRIQRRDKNGDAIEDDDDVDVDIDMDDWDGQARLISAKAQELAMEQAQKSMVQAQKAVAASMKEWQPRLENEMKKAQAQIQEEMKRMQEKLQEMQDRE